MKSSPDIRSSLYECRVLHERFAPRHHRFVYKIFYFAIDLDELPRLHETLTLFSVNRGNIVSFREDDFMPFNRPPANPSSSNEFATHSGAPLKTRVLGFCAKNGTHLDENARVLLITLPRTAGFLFNPVSFYFCYDANGRPACAITEVTNTYREVKPYFIPTANAARGKPSFRLRIPKNFYVSPFSSVDISFDFHLRPPGEKLAVRIDDFEDSKRLIHTTLTGRQAPLTNRRLNWFLIKYPLATMATILRIHWQALLIWRKKIPHFPKAARSRTQQDVYRPHTSISPRIAP